MRDHYQVTVSGGIKIAAGTLVTVAVACVPHLKNNRTVFVRNTRDLTVTVELRNTDDGLNVTATTYGVSCEPPAWAEQLSNILQWENT